MVCVSLLSIFGVDMAIGTDIIVDGGQVLL